MNNILKKTALGIIFLIPLIPFLVFDNFFFPFIVGKALTFRILVEILVGLWAILAIQDVKYRPKFSWILVFVVAFVAVIGLSDVLGVYPMKSVWSNFERMEGWVTLFHLLGFFIATTSILKTERKWHQFFNISILASVLMGFYGLLQLAGKFEVHQGTSRLDATFGNSAYLAVYMLFHIFMTALFLFRERGQSIWKWLYGLAIILQTIILYYTGTRGTLLGLLVGVFVTSLFVALFEKNNKKLKKICIAGLAGVVLLVGLFISLKNTSFVQNSPVLNRMASISFHEKTVRSRFMVWQMAIDGFKERPLLGWGQENFNYVFNKYYNPKMYDQEQWFDRTHNVFFDWLIAGGLLGLLAYLLLFFGIIFYLFKDENNYFNVLDKGIILGLLAGYFVHNFFVFDHLISYLLFFSLLGYLHSLNVEENNSLFDKKFSENVMAVLIPFVIVATLFSLYYFNTKVFLTNTNLLNALKPHKEGLVKNLDYFKKASSGGFTGKQEAREQLAQFGVKLSSKVPEDFKQKIIELVSEEMGKQIKEDPENARIESITGTFYGRVGDYEKSLKHLNRAIELSPNKISLIELAGNVYLFKGDLAKSTEYFKRAFDLVPESFSLRVSYISNLIYLGKDEEAGQILASSSPSIIHDSKIIQAYVVRKKYKKAISLLKDNLKNSPNDKQKLLSLAAVYSEAGYKIKAIETIKLIVKLYPDFKEQGDYYIREIRAGRQ